MIPEVAVIYICLWTVVEVMKVESVLDFTGISISSVCKAELNKNSINHYNDVLLFF